MARAANFERFSNVLDRNLGSNPVYVCNLSDILRAPALRDIFNESVAARRKNIGVDIRTLRAFFVLEALEKQAIWNRVKLMNSEKIGYKAGSGRATCDTSPDLL